MNSPLNFDPIAKYYDLLYADREDDLDLWFSLTENITGPLLEVGCGTGRVTLPLLQAQKHVTAIDISAEALQKLKQKISLAKVKKWASVHQADMRALNLPQKKHAFAFIPINTFMHCLTLADQQATLKSIYNHLQPGGLLALDLYHPHPEALMEADGRMVLVKQIEDNTDGNIIQWYIIRKLRLDEQIQDITFILDEISATGALTRQTLNFPMRYLHRFEAELLLEQAGFTLVDLFGDYDQAPFFAQSPRMIYLAQKP